ncbi:MAG: thiamine pyrophosphate-binding protein [Chloroflexi bacterium]|jgi:benzoylformate decarboxylase|nr:thiamine pyrophosphate-binding protein [Chloroflexota bacterium]MBT4073333.1 thiamine pyrophosphate-binding protein [Chloroflexota bacterium]MBT4514137.1 thiamine pyrophosphate-binding protein [Chloroflexota bacterium]MBT5319516.1 thiamine pyrophosphate-binding protein [Chloroflexota bacterium]
MATRPITANASRVMVEQLVASGVDYVFYNSGSREARFFDSLHANPDIQGILSLHEGIVTAAAGGYSQVKGDTAVMVVHLGAGLAQCLGQLINVWAASLPVVVITFAGDTGSFADRISLDLGHSFGPTSIAAPFVKASWAVYEPEGLPQAFERAIRVAKTPPYGPVHLAIYDRLLEDDLVTTNIIEGDISGIRAGYPADADVEALAAALDSAERPMFYIGDGIWKSGAEANMIALAEHYGATVTTSFDDARGVPVTHPLHCGRIDLAADRAKPDLIVGVGVRHQGNGKTNDFAAFDSANSIMSIGSGVENFQNLPGLALEVLADEARTLERLQDVAAKGAPASKYDARREAAQGHATALRDGRRATTGWAPQKAGQVRPLVLLEALDSELERIGGGIITTEQFAAPFDCIPAKDGGGNNIYIRPAGGSEGYGIGGAIGAKLGAPDTPVVGLVGDGSTFYHDSGLWTAVHHNIPVLYVIPNNGAYGIVAGAFGAAGEVMTDTGEYASVALEGIDPVVIASGFGMDGATVDDESKVAAEIARGLDIVMNEKRPYILDVKLPLGLPQGGTPAEVWKFAG